MHTNIRHLAAIISKGWVSHFRRGAIWRICPLPAAVSFFNKGVDNSLSIAAQRQPPAVLEIDNPSNGEL
jgi:hypothetical protein